MSNVPDITRGLARATISPAPEAGPASAWSTQGSKFLSGLRGLAEKIANKKRKTNEIKNEIQGLLSSVRNVYSLLETEAVRNNVPIENYKLSVHFVRLSTALNGMLNEKSMTGPKIFPVVVLLLNALADSIETLSKQQELIEALKRENEELRNSLLEATAIMTNLDRDLDTSIVSQPSSVADEDDSNSEAGSVRSDMSEGMLANERKIHQLLEPCWRYLKQNLTSIYDQAGSRWVAVTAEGLLAQGDNEKDLEINVQKRFLESDKEKPYVIVELEKSSDGGIRWKRENPQQLKCLPLLIQDAI